MCHPAMSYGGGRLPSQELCVPPEASVTRTAPTLTGAQRRYLRGLAHPLKPVIFVGEAGVSDSVLSALEDALRAHELVKIRLRQPTDKKQAAQHLARASQAALCGIVGHTVVLYRPDPESPKIELRPGA
jgi:RNA-binding protein